ncbi:HK97 family phage prohead protease [Alistipes finegoldii]|uniref:HK97 family phage prohead protease n=1 Tax=Alistipes finegoldii TaxID=214856 RepID=UPI003A8996C5
MAREAVITSNSVNAYGTRVLTEGLDISQYEKNPIVLYMHQRGIPIGTMNDLRIENDRLIGTPQIDGDTDEEKVIAAKWERGTLRMLSAGIEILEWSDDPQNVVQGQTRPTVTRSKLVEVSIVDVGANDDALQVRLYSGGKLLTLAQGEDNDLLPLLRPDNDDKPQNKTFQMNEILMLLGLPTTATEADAATAIRALKTENETLTLARITDAVTAAKDNRQITEAQMPKMIELGKKAGIDSLRDYLSMMTPAAKPSDILGGDNKVQGGTVTLSWDKLSDNEKLRLRKENPSEYIQLFKAHYGVTPDFTNEQF